MTGYLKKSVALLLAWFIIASPIDAPTQDKPVTSHCNALLGGLARRSNDKAASDGSDYFDSFIYHGIPKDAVGVANAVLPGKVATLIVSPSDEQEYRNIFIASSKNTSKREDLTPAQVAELKSVKASLKNTLGRDQPDNLTQASMVSHIKDMPESFVILVGHNKNGDFRFADRSSMSMDLIAQGARSDQRLIFISCQSADYITETNSAGVRRELTYPEAFQIAKSIQDYVGAANAGASIEMVKKRLESAELNIGVKSQVKYFLMQAACFTAGAIIVALFISFADPCLHEDKC